MTEPTTTGGATWSIASWAAMMLGSQLPFINPYTLIGAVGGGLVYMIFDDNLPAFRRTVAAIVSVFIGYIAEPEIMTRTGLETHGIGSFLVSSLLIVGTVFIMGLVRSGRIMDIFNRGKS